MAQRGPFNTWRTIITVGAALSFIVVALNGIIGYRMTRLIVADFAEARQASNTILALDEILNDVVDAETGQRGFILTGDDRYLQPYQQGAQLINSDLGRLDHLLSTEPAQQGRLRALHVAISVKFDELTQTIRAYERDGSQAAIAIVDGGRGQQAMESIRQAISAMKTEEELEREAARLHADDASGRALKGGVAATSVAGLLLLATFVSVGAAARANQLAREEAESANRVKDHFLATVSHELRTPLTSILGWSAILNDDDVDPRTLREGLATIQSSASVQKKLIEDLLDVSRIESGKLRLSMRTLDLTEAVRVAVDSMRPAADAKSIALITSIASGIRVSGDPDRVQQIVWNLMTNAVKFTPRGGRIEVSVAQTDSRALIEISDSGEGIDPSFLPHVFEPFRQSDSSRARVHQGLGLGLSIVKYLVEAHGGIVSVWSRGKGEGTKFRVSLPIMPIVHGEISDESTSPLGDETTNMPAALAEPEALRDLRILIVDDHPPTREILWRLLKKCGAEVFSARTAAEAMTLFRAHRPDVLVSDVGMPGEDGLTLLDHIRRLPASAGGQTPAVALTAYLHKEDSQRVLASGFQAYLTKPVEPLELVNAIRNLGGAARAGA